MPMTEAACVSAQCEIVDVSPVLLALTEAELARPEIPRRIRDLFDTVYAWLRDSGVRQVGHNYAMYDRCTPQRLRIRVGFPVSERFADTDSVRCTELAAGRAARAVHVGSYDKLHVTYAVLEEWCTRNALARSGESWEVYGDWTEDMSKLETTIFLRLSA